MTDYQVLGPYRVEAKLGQGGMGTVYRGVHVTTGQRVAVKVLASQMSHEARFRRRFDSEIETLKRLNHPNIVRLIGFGEEHGALFYSMELVEGPSLLEHLRKVKRLDWDTTIGFAIEICAALKHAHDLGIIHRDLKPANLLLEPEGRLKLTDFGIAKLFGATEQTAAGAVLGTADYMAPEQASGQPTTPRTDLYALGSLMYACLAGRPPFGGRNLTQVIHGLKHETPAPLDLVLPDVPPELAELIHELLQKVPEDRPPTALAVGKRLRALRVGLRHRAQPTLDDLGSATITDAEQVGADASASQSGTRSGTHSGTHSGTRAGTHSGTHSGPSHPAVTDDPTAAEDASHLPTGAAVGMEPTIAAQAPPPHGQHKTARPSPTEHTAPSPPPRTHFEMVSGGQSDGSDAWEPTKPAGDARHWVSIAGLVVMLLATCGIVIWMLQQPSAGNMLESIQQAEAAEDERAYETAVESFLRVHPDHFRSPQLRQAQAAGEVDRMIARLRRRAASRGGAENLDPPEQAWLEAVTPRADDPRRAAQMLTHWLDVYDLPAAADDSVPGDESTRRLARLARVEAARLATAPVPTNSRAEQLRSWVQWNLQHRRGKDRQNFLRSVKALHGDDAWADEVLAGLPDVDE